MACCESHRVSFLVVSASYHELVNNAHKDLDVPAVVNVDKMGLDYATWSCSPLIEDLEVRDGTRCGLEGSSPSRMRR